jgi:Ala-tRNA(Pro) deacylase
MRTLESTGPEVNYEATLHRNQTSSHPHGGGADNHRTGGFPTPPSAGVCKRKEEGSMACAKLQEYLDSQSVKYVSIKHSPAFTAQEIAASAHIPGQDVAKTVVVKLDGEMALVALPATQMVRMNHLKAVMGVEKAELASEEEFKGRFPDCEVGAMPPFGNLYQMDTLVDEALAKDHEIAFNAGTHTELIRMTYADFDRLVRPKLLKG